MDDAMSKLTDEDRLAILNEAYNTVENLSDAEVEAPLDPYRPDVLDHWNAMREQSQPSKPQQYCS